MAMTRRQILQHASYATQLRALQSVGQMQPLICYSNVDLNEHVRPSSILDVHVGFIPGVV